MTPGGQKKRGGGGFVWAVAMGVFLKEEGLGNSVGIKVQITKLRMSAIGGPVQVGAPLECSNVLLKIGGSGDM